MLYLKSGEQVAIQEIDAQNVLETVYNFHVEELESYAVGAGSVLVHNKSCEFVADANVFFDKPLMDRVRKAKSLTAFLPKAILKEIKHAADIVRLNAAKANVVVRRAANVKAIRAAAKMKDFLSKKFGLNDLKLVETAKQLNLPIVTTNKALKNQLTGHAERKKLYGAIKVLVPGIDFNNIRDLKKLLK